MQKKPVLCVFLCVHPELFQVPQFIPSSFMRLPFSNALQSSSPSLCVHACVCLYVCVFPCCIVSVSSGLSKCQRKLLLFPDHLCETDQPHRRGNPLFWLKERGKRGEERDFYSSEHPQVSSFSLALVHCSSGLNHVVNLPGFTILL